VESFFVPLTIAIKSDFGKEEKKGFYKKGGLSSWRDERHGCPQGARAFHKKSFGARGDSSNFQKKSLIFDGIDVIINVNLMEPFLAPPDKK